MSNYLAIATVTETLRQLLDDVVGKAIPGASAAAVRPTGTAGSAGLPKVGVNLYLYQVTPNGAGRNSDLPTRREDGTLIQRPRVALDLHYVLSFYGEETKFETQRLLALVVRTLHGQPLLARQKIQSAIQTIPALAESDLADEIELVKFTPSPLSLEELSKLWSIMLQTPYTLSIAYQASVVFIEGKEAPQRALPVRRRGVYVMPFRQPVVDQVSPQVVLPGDTLTLIGRNLQGEVTRTRCGTVEVVPAEVSDTEIKIVLPANLPAGVRTVQVIHQLRFRLPSDPHKGFESNLAAFVLASKITTAPPISVARGATLSLDLSPPVGREQDVILLIGDRAIPIPRRPSGAPASTSKLDFPIPADFSAGEFLLRIRVDGADSLLDFDPATNLYSGPKVTLT